MGIPAPTEKMQACYDEWVAAGRPLLAHFARDTGRPLTTVDRWIKSHMAKSGEKLIKSRAAASGFETKPAPPEMVDVHELLSERRRKFGVKDEFKRSRHLIDVRVKLDGPIGIAHFGDPHLDDDGTDIALVEEHIRIIKRSPGLFAANVGDTTNNWVGRLERLYGQQSTSAAEAWALAEWFIRELDWLIFLDGNHGAWSGAGDPVKWILRGNPGIHGGMSARVNLIFPDRRAVRINARHDFKGTSQWNTAHGPAKAAQMGWRDHVLTCGHLHTSGYNIVKCPATGLLSHAIRVASYKTHDRYADELGLPNQNISPNVVTIINPQYADDDPRLITVLHDIEHGADYLKFLRSRKTK